MDAAAALIEEAERLARIADRRASDLQAELEEIEAKKAEINAECDLARGAAKRLLNYKPTSGINCECPKCWIVDGVHAKLRSIPGTNDSDIFRCGACGNDWHIPI